MGSWTLSCSRGAPGFLEGAHRMHCIRMTLSHSIARPLTSVTRSASPIILVSRPAWSGSSRKRKNKKRIFFALLDLSKNSDALGASPPTLWHPSCDDDVLPVTKTRIIILEPPSPNGGLVARRGGHYFLRKSFPMKIVFTMDSRLRASPRHGGTGRFIVIQSQIRRGGAPSGAAAFIVKTIFKDRA
jgi:hypothetical protein